VFDGDDGDPERRPDTHDEHWGGTHAADFDGLVDSFATSSSGSDFDSVVYVLDACEHPRSTAVTTTAGLNRR
jgi:hypothetical protein